MGMAGLGGTPAGGKGVSPNVAQGDGRGFLVATFHGFRADLGEENVATLIDSIEFCTACHAEGRGFEPRRSRHDFANET